MGAARSAWLLCLMLTFAACSKHQAGERPPARAPSAATPAAPHARAGSATAPSAAASSTHTRANADGSETVEDATGDSGVHNPLFAAVASTVAAATSTAAADTPLTGPTLWQDGVNYTRVVPAQPTSVAAGQVEVLEFFWYACPHCYAIDPLVESWRKSKPSYISFARVPVTWSPSHRALGRLYYTLDSLGKIDQWHPEVFSEIQVNGDPLVARNPNDDAETERIQTVFAKKLGIPQDAFKNAYHSFNVDNDLLKADEAVMRYRVDGVPTFVINGKYVADVRTAGSQERLIALVGDLAAQEHKH
jgi:protein dithiol oxidoreductase (disulfide-forming)